MANKCFSSLNLLSTSFGARSFIHHSTSVFSPERTRHRLSTHVLDACRRFVGRHNVCDDSVFPNMEFPHGFSYANAAHSAVPLAAPRVSLPSEAGTADLLDLLPPHLSTLYATPELLLRSSPARCRVRPSASCESPQDYIALIARLLDLGMVDLRAHVSVVNGVFGVRKDEHSLRLIIDARPANAAFIEPPHIDLPTPDLFAHLQASDQPLFVAKVDLDNFYHRLRIPQWMVPYFGLPPVPAAAFGLTGDVVYPCCTTLPMGFSHSVFLAQHCHEHLLNTRTPLQPHDRITPTSDLLLNRTRHAAYIDDCILIGPDPVQIRAYQQHYLLVVADSGIPAKPSKVVPPTSDSVECLGFEIDGHRHTVGVSTAKLRSLIALTERLIARGFCTGLDLAELVGRWSWAILARRPAFAAFNSVYRFIQKAGRRYFDLWPSVVRELHLVIGLSPLLFARIDSGWFRRCVATDASQTGMGVVSASLPDHRAVAFAGLSSTSAAEIASVPSLPWATIVSSPWRVSSNSGPEHINVLELRAITTALRWVLSSPSSPGRRVLLFTDSTVAALAVSKGRSSSFQILRRLRYLSSLVLASGLQLFCRWLPSELNPADGPSRAFGW